MQEASLVRGKGVFSNASVVLGTTVLLAGLPAPGVGVAKESVTQEGKFSGLKTPIGDNGLDKHY